MKEMQYKSIALNGLQMMKLHRRKEKDALKTKGKKENRQETIN